jgi:queuine tRNA-ribosyltransferase
MGTSKKMMKAINFKIEKKIENKLGRAGILETPHGIILTPSFAVVGTKATAKSLNPEQIKEAKTQVVLANTYHLYLQPGDELIKKIGGIQNFMNWYGPTMTDSGGFQVFSLGVAYGKELSKVVSISDPSLLIPERSSIEDGIPKLATIGNDGVSFRSHIDGSLHYITPEKSIEIQHNLGADIIFAFDECTSPTENEVYQEEALSRTHAWAKRSLEKHLQLEIKKQNPPQPPLVGGGENTEGLPDKGDLGVYPQALFGIVQGGRSEILRKKSAEIIGLMEFDGFGIGGSFAKEDMANAVLWVNEILPEEKPRHLLGIGEPEDLFMGVENGVDLFDCVGPTRIARNGTLFTKNGKINILNKKFIDDFNSIEEDCECYTCKNFKKAYLSHLFRAKEMLGATLATIHNVYFINKLVADMRQAILDGSFFEFKKEFLEKYF